MKKLALLPLLMAAQGVLAQAVSPVGTWTTPEKATIQVYTCNGSKLCAKILSLPQPNDPKTGKPQTDYNNPDSQLRSRPVQGLVILQDLAADGENKWDDGKIYDPKSGKTYSCSAKLTDNKTLELRGYMGIALAGRTQKWTRIK